MSPATAESILMRLAAAALDNFLLGFGANNKKIITYATKNYPRFI
jgi:hypothetical protein